MERTGIRRWLAMVGACCLVAGGAAVAGNAGAGAGLLPLPGPLGEAGSTVTMSSNRFLPDRIVVKVGGSVNWTNNDTIGHSATADDGSFDSNPTCGASKGTCLDKGQTFTATFSKPGHYPYYCRIHGATGGGGMAGVVDVV